jgi:PIN domain nuclease of toxin-antitoxin system
MIESSSAYVLDTFAILAHFQAETGGEKVKELLKSAGRGEISLAMSLINVGEMLYIVGREQGRDRAESMLADLRALPVKLMMPQKLESLPPHG